MKIAIVRKRYTDFGGAERYINVLTSWLADLGHEVHIFANEWKPASGIFFHKVSMIKGLSVLKAMSFAINAKRLLKKSGGFDIVHSFERTLYQDVYRAGDGCHKEWLIQRAKYEPSWKTFLVRINPLHWALLWIEKRLFDPKNTKILIANSKKGKDEIIRHYRFPEDRIHIIYNGVDFKRFNPSQRKRYRTFLRESLGIVETDKVLLFMGSGFKRKGLAFAIEALARVHNPEVKLIVAGRDTPGKYRRLSKRLGIEDQIFFVGPTKEPEKLYAAADLFILPTIYEPFSNACLEALAFGIPVITTKMNGISDLIDEDVTGVCIDRPSDTERLAIAIEKFLKSGQGISAWAKEEMARFSIEKNVRETVQLYTILLKNS